MKKNMELKCGDKRFLLDNNMDHENAGAAELVLNIGVHLPGAVENTNLHHTGS